MDTVFDADLPEVCGFMRPLAPLTKVPRLQKKDEKETRNFKRSWNGIYSLKKRFKEVVNTRV